MGDSVWFMACPGPAPADALDWLADLADAMRAAGLIEGDNEPGAILGNPRGPVYRSGPAVDALVPVGHGRLSALRTNGAEFCTDPIFNYAQLNREVFACPNCGEAIPAAAQVDALGTAAAEGDFGPGAVRCARCHAPTAVNDWAEGTGFIIAGCGLALWNWPVLEEVLAPVRGLVREAFDGQLVEDGQRI
ncbi:MAG: hypothetical protein JXQ91_11920 [Vannielia sp.]|uniref:hypothetical protein n=1 Tax=Rhodobacterales TaxID=204455 RepID=UPI0020940F97|nr:hypothetical protein [Oceanicola sp. 502str15]MCO6383832.1 hypothetical protein [Oceanicola sp. 502str15]